jgi:hypothetical protein
MANNYKDVLVAVLSACAIIGFASIPLFTDLNENVLKVTFYFAHLVCCPV